MSLSWIRQKLFNSSTDNINKLSALPDPGVAVTESLLMELDYHIQETCVSRREREMAQQREKTGVDYSWLASKAAKPYRMPQVERFEIEELCAKVLPAECGRVMEVFRISMARQPPANEVPRILRSIIIQVIEDRPRDEESSWISKSLVNLRARANSNRITPAESGFEELEMGSSTSRSRRTTQSVSEPVFTIHNEMNV